jgi:hypothetical protein
MKKIFFISFLFSFVNLSFGQSGRDQKKANIATEEWRYELSCKGTGGADNSYLIDVVSYLRDDKLSINQSKKNAVHGIIFKGVFGNSVGCQTKPALTKNANLFDEKREYFDTFFADGGTFSKFVILPTGRPDKVDQVTKTEYRVNMTVQVNVIALREQLETDGIIEKFAKLDKSVIKPRIIIYPSDAWAINDKGYSKKTDDQNGGFKVTPDYEKAILDDDFMVANGALSKLFLKRDYPPIDMKAEIDKINEEKLISKFSEDQSQTSFLDQIINVVKPDIKISVYWKVNSKPPNSQLYYQLKAVDTYTGELVSSADGNGPESRSALIGELIEQSVNDKMDDFINTFQTYFNKMEEEGRKVQLEVAISEGFTGNLEKEYTIDGESLPLKEIISDWMTENALSEPNAVVNKTKMTLKDIRIPLNRVKKSSKSGKASAVNAQTFLDELRQYLKSTLQINSTVESRGLGLAKIIIGTPAPE